MTLAILPVKKISERVPNKNFRSVGDNHYGIFEIKLRQLLSCDFVTDIMITTDSNDVNAIAFSLCARHNSENKKRIHHHLRPERYSGSCPNHEWVAYLSTQIDDIHVEDVMLCFATSPFFDSQQFESFYHHYKDSEFDSLAVASKIQTYLWKDGKPFNYDSGWPLTQTLNPVYQINSTAFICSKKDFINTQDRLPGKVGFFESSPLNSCINIDTEKDFENFLQLWSLLN